MEIFISLIPFLNGGYYYLEYFAIGIILILFLCLKKEIKIENNMVMYSLIGLLISYIISIRFAVDPGLAFTGTIKFLVVIFLYISIVNSDKEKLKKNMVISGVALVVLGVIFNKFHSGRLISFVGYANVFGMYLLMCIYFLKDMYVNKKYKFFLEVILFIGAVLTFSRAIYILLGIILLKYDRKKVLLIIGIIVGVSLFNSSSERVIKGTESSSVLERFFYYEDSIKMVHDNPFGIGEGGYYYLQKKYQTAYYSTKFVHSAYLQKLIDVGIIGSVCFLILLLLIFKESNHKYMLMVFLTHSAIDLNFEFLLGYLMLFMLMKDQELLIGMKFKKKYMLLILIVMITGLLFISKSKITAEDYYVIGNFEEAIRVNPNHYKALYGYIEELELDKEYKKAEIYTLKYIHNYPYDIKGYEKLVDIYIFLNKYDKIKDIENMLKDVKITERAYRLKRVPDLNLKKYIEEKERKNKNVR